MNLLSKLLPPKVAEAIAALLAVATVLGVGGVANAESLTTRRANKAAAKTAAKAA